MIAKAFKEHGRPTGYIMGEELAGAATIGLRYAVKANCLLSRAVLRRSSAGPSIGIRSGRQCPAFVLVYNAHKTDDLPQALSVGRRQRSLCVGGAGINYQQRDDIIPAPIRLGVGLRAGRASAIPITPLTKHAESPERSPS